MNPGPLGRGPSLADEEKALKSGNTGVLVAGVIAAVLVTGGIGAVLVMNGGDDTEAYSAIGRRINGMKQEHFDGFWTCALPGQQLSQLSSDQDLRRAINERANRSPSRYADLVRSECMVKLTEHEPGLRELIPPEDLAAQLGDLTTALVDLRGAWNDYIRDLSQAQDGYDEDAFSGQVSKIAKGWYDYKHAYSEINDTIREHITE